jgi:hypothetical protein
LFAGWWFVWVDFRLAQASFELNIYLYKYPFSLVPIVILVHTTYEDGTDEMSRNVSTQFRRQGITQNKEYSIHNKRMFEIKIMFGFEELHYF